MSTTLFTSHHIQSGTNPLSEWSQACSVLFLSTNPTSLVQTLITSYQTFVICLALSVWHCLLHTLNSGEVWSVSSYSPMPISCKISAPLIFRYLGNLPLSLLFRTNFWSASSSTAEFATWFTATSLPRGPKIVGPDIIMKSPRVTSVCTQTTRVRAWLLSSSNYSIPVSSPSLPLQLHIPLTIGCTLDHRNSVFKPWVMIAPSYSSII